MQRVPELAGRELVLTPLSGGITNRNFRVDADGGLARPARRPTWVIRLAGNDTHLLGISREVEHAATVAAAGVGVGPEVIAFIRPEGYLVTRFIVGTGGLATRPSTTRRPSGAWPIRIRRIHDGPAIPGIFVPLRIGEAYRALAIARGVAIPAGVRRCPRRIGGGSRSPSCATRSSCGRATTTCSTPTSSTTATRIRIVDWEYAGMGDPFFDLGNFSVNHELDADEDAILLEAYEGEVRPERLARLRLMRVVSDFREAMWGVLQQGISTLDVDFVAYADAPPRAARRERIGRRPSRPTCGASRRAMRWPRRAVQMAVVDDRRATTGVGRRRATTHDARRATWRSRASSRSVERRARHVATTWRRASSAAAA